MRRFFGLAFLLGAFACAGSAERSRDAPETTGTVTSPAFPRGGTAVVARGSAGEVPATDLPVRPSTGGACASSVTLRGNPGTVVAQPSVTMLFWGAYWTAAGNAERQQYTAAWSTLASDPAFYARLAEYSTSTAALGTGSWAGATLGDPSLVNGALITEAQIQQELAAEIAAGTAARFTESRIYVVMLPPGVTSQLDQQNNFAGHHAQFTADGATLPVRYAVITYDLDPGYTDPVVSHEITEATTDPDLSTGWYDDFGLEIADLCRFHYATLDGYAIEQTWSTRACACVGGTAGPDTGTDAGVAAGPDTGTDAGVADTGADASISSCTAPAWSPSATYTGGTTISYAGSQYTASYWNQSAEPDTHSGATGSGQPWLLPVACAPTTCAPACSGKQCGGDGCGGSCGSCASGQTCTTTGTCQSPPTGSCTGLTPWSPSQPWYAYAVGEQHTGGNGHRYTCKNVAYCIDDPTGTVGGTYGWNDDGPC